MIFVFKKLNFSQKLSVSTMLSRQTNMMQQLQIIRANESQKDKSGTRYTEQALPSLSHKKQLRKLIDGYIKKTQNGYFISSVIFKRYIK